MSLHPGEVWLADLGMAAKTRPVVIVSRHDPDAPRALVIYVPLTTQNRGSRYEVVLPRLGFLRTESVANVQGIASIGNLGWNAGSASFPNQRSRPSAKRSRSLSR